MRPRHDVEVEDQAGYLELIRSNASLRRLWVGNIVSLLGDWFNTIALYSLVTELTGSPFALGAVFITKLLPGALSSPIAGVMVDRYNRRRLMIGSDLLRAVVVLGLLFIDEPGEVWLLYLLTGLQVVIGSVFQPAQSASIPNLATPRELVTANALMSATWSVMLALGAALGGIATDALGVQAVFVLDSLTYVVSAWFIYRASVPQFTREPGTEPLVRAAVREIVEGWHHLRTHPRVSRIALAKASWALGGGGLVYMLTLLGGEISPGAAAVGIGFLFAVRGVGTGIGPIAARVLFRDQSRWPLVLGLCIAASGIAYGLVGFVPWSYAVAGLVLLAHAFSGANWVLATVMLQKRTEDRFRGRVFATEWLLVMLADSCSILASSLMLEAGVVDLRTSFVLFAGLQFGCGLLWLLLVVPAERRGAEPPLRPGLAS